MARLRFPGRPGHRFDRLSVKYFSDDVKNIQDPSLAFLPQFQRGLKAFRDLVGLSDEEDEFEGFTPRDVKASEKKLNAFLKEQKKQEQAQLEGAEDTTQTLSVSGKRSSKSLKKSNVSISTLASQVGSSEVAKDVFPYGRGVKIKDTKLYEHRNKPKKFKLDYKHGVPGAKVKRSEMDMAKFLLEKAKQANALQEQAKARKLAAAKSPVQVQKKEFVLPSQSSRSSRVIKPNKRFLEDDSVHSVVKKKSKPCMTPVDNTLTSKHEDDKPCFSPELVGNTGVDSSVGLLDQPLIVDGKRDRKPSLKLQLSDVDQPILFPTHSSITSPLAAPKLGTSLFSKSQFQKASEKQKLGMMGFGASRLHGASIVQKAKLQLNRAALNKSKAALARSLKAEMKREAKFAEQVKHQELDSGLTLLSPSKPKGDVKKPRKWKRCAVCGKRKELVNCFDNILACRSCRRFYRECTGNIKVGTFVQPTCYKNERCNLVPDKIKCRFCRIKKLLDVGFPSIPELEAIFKGETVAPVQEPAAVIPDVKSVKSPASVKKATKPPSAFPDETVNVSSPSSNTNTSVQVTKKTMQSPPHQTEIPLSFSTPLGTTPDTSSKEQELSPLKAGEASEKRHRKKRAFKELLKNKQEKVEDLEETSFEKPAIQDSPPLVLTGSVEVSPREGGAGPRIKHVCRNAAVVLGQPLATFPEKSELRLSALPTKDKVQLWKKDEESKAASAESDDERPIEDIIQQSGDSVVIMKKTPSKIKSTKKLTGAGGLHLYKRKMRCKKCDGCKRQDCGVCRHCKDMKKFGGPGIYKKACEQRRCTSPLIQRSATEAFIIEKKIKRAAAVARAKTDDEPSDDDKPCTETDLSQRDFGSGCDFDPVIPGSHSSQTMLGLETQTGTLLDDQTQSNNNVVDKCSVGANIKQGNQSDQGSMSGIMGPSSIQISPKKNSRSEVRKLTFEEIPDFQLERISSRNKQPGKIPSKLTKKLDMQEKYSKKQGGNDGQCYPVTLQSVLPASRQWGSLLSQPRYHPIKVDFKGKRDMASCWKYGMALTLSSAMSVRTLCILCGSTGKHDLIYCNICCEPYHEFCLEEWEQPSAGQCDDWICAACQFCHVCGRQNNLLQCDKCQNTYHPGCLGPNYPTQPSKRKKIWICTKCVKCKSCGATTPGSGSQATWTYDFSLCYECGQLMDKGNFCPICHKCYSDDDWESKMIQCNKCDSWVHSKCEGLTDEMYEILSSLPEDLSFYCRKCYPYPCPEWESTLKRELQLGLENILQTLILSKSAQFILKHEKKKSPSKLAIQSSEDNRIEETSNINSETNIELHSVNQASDKMDAHMMETETSDKVFGEKCSVNCSVSNVDELQSVQHNAGSERTKLLTDANSCENSLEQFSEVSDMDKESLTRTPCDINTQNADNLSCDQVSDSEKTKSCDSTVQGQINMHHVDTNVSCDVSTNDRIYSSTSCDKMIGCDLKHSNKTADTIQGAGCQEGLAVCSLTYDGGNESTLKTVTHNTSGCEEKVGPENAASSVNVEISSEAFAVTTSAANSDKNLAGSVTSTETVLNPGAQLNDNNSEIAKVQVNVSAQNNIPPIVSGSVVHTVVNGTKKSNHVHFNVKENNVVALKDEAEVLKEDYPLDLMEVTQKMRTGSYKSVTVFCEDILRVIQTYLDNDGETRTSRKKAIQSARSIFVKQLQVVFPWFNVKNCRHWYSMKSLPDGMLPDATLPPSTDHTYAQWLERRELPRSPQPSPFKKRIATPVKKLVPIDDDDEYGLGLLFEGDDERKCMFCQLFGDQDGNDAGRLLYCGQDDWCHINCALWSAEVYEDEDGALENLPEAFSRGKMLKCDRCGKVGATVGCNTRGCKANYHFMCARHERCRFQEDKKVFCYIHRMFIDRELINPDGFNVLRRVYVGALNVRALKKRWSKGLHCSDVSVLIGSCCVEALGRLTDLSDLPKYLQPVDFIATRMYWSTRDARRRCVYTCKIIEVRPETLKSPTVQIKDMRIVHDSTHPDYVPITSFDLTGSCPEQDESTHPSTIVELDSMTGVSTVEQTMESMDVSNSVVSENSAVTKHFNQKPAQNVTRSTKGQHSRRASFGGTTCMVTSSASENLSKSWPISKPVTTKDTLQSGLSFLSPKTLKMLNISDPSKYMKPIQTEQKPMDDEDEEMGLLKIADRLNRAAAKCSVRKNDVHSPLFSRSDMLSPLSTRSDSRSPSIERITSSRPFSPIVGVRQRSQSVDRVSEIRPFSPLSFSIRHKLSSLPEKPFSPPARLLNRSKSLSIERELITKQPLPGTGNKCISLLSEDKAGTLNIPGRGRSVSDPLNFVPEPVNFSSPVSNSKPAVKAAANVFTESEDDETSMEVDDQSVCPVSTSESEKPGLESDDITTDVVSGTLGTNTATDVTNGTAGSDDVSYTTDTTDTKVDNENDGVEASFSDSTVHDTTETIVVMTESGESLSEEDAIKIVQDMIDKKQILTCSEGIQMQDEVVNTVVEGLVDAVNMRIGDNADSQDNDNAVTDPVTLSDEVNPESPFIPTAPFETNDYARPSREVATISGDNNSLQETNQVKEMNNITCVDEEDPGNDTGKLTDIVDDIPATKEEGKDCMTLGDDLSSGSDDDIVDITDSVRQAVSGADLHSSSIVELQETNTVNNSEMNLQNQSPSKRIVYDLDESIDSDIELLDDISSKTETDDVMETDNSTKTNDLIIADAMQSEKQTIEQNVDHKSTAIPNGEHNVDEIDGEKVSKEELYCELKDIKEDLECNESRKLQDVDQCADTELDSDVMFFAVSDDSGLDKQDHVDKTVICPQDSDPESTLSNSKISEKSSLESKPLEILSSDRSPGVLNNIESSTFSCDSENITEAMKNDSSVQLPVLDPISKKIKEESIAKSCPGEKGPFKCSKCRRMYRTESSYRVHVENCNFLVSSSDDDDVNCERESEGHLFDSHRETRSSKIKRGNESGDKNVNEDVEATKRSSLRRSTQCQRVALEVEEKRIKEDDVPKRRGRPSLRSKDAHSADNNELMAKGDKECSDNEPRGKCHPKKGLENSGAEFKTVMEAEKKCEKLTAREIRRKSREIKILESLSQSSDSENESNEQMKSKIVNRKRSLSKSDNSTLDSKEDKNDISKSPVAKRKLRSASNNSENKCESSQELGKELGVKFEDKEARILLKSQVEQLRISRKKATHGDFICKDFQKPCDGEQIDSAGKGEDGLKHVSVKLCNITSNVAVQRKEICQDKMQCDSDKDNSGAYETKIEVTNEIPEHVLTDEESCEKTSVGEKEQSKEQDSILDPESGWIVDKNGKKLWSPTIRETPSINDDKTEVNDDNEEHDYVMDEKTSKENEIGIADAENKKLEVDDGSESTPIGIVEDDVECSESQQYDNNHQPHPEDVDHTSVSEEISNNHIPEKPRVSDQTTYTVKKSVDSDFGHSLPTAVLKLLKEGHKVVIKNPKLGKCFIWQKTADGYVGKPFDKTLVKSPLPVDSKANDRLKTPPPITPKANESVEVPANSDPKTPSDASAENVFQGGFGGNKTSTSKVEPKTASQILFGGAKEEKKIASGNLPVTGFNRMLDPSVREKIAEKIDSLIEGSKQYKSSNPSLIKSVSGAAEYVGGVMLSPSGLDSESMEKIKQKIKSTVPIASDLIQHGLIQKNYVNPGNFVENMQTNHLANVVPNQQISSSNVQFITQPGIPFMQQQIQAGTNIVTGVQLSYGNLAMSGLQAIPVSNGSQYLCSQPKLPQQPHQIQFQQLANIQPIQTGFVNIPVMTNVNLTNNHLLSSIPNQLIAVQASMPNAQVRPPLENNSYQSLISQNHSLLTKALAHNPGNDAKPSSVEQKVKSPLKPIPSPNKQISPKMEKEKSTGSSLPALGGCNPALMKKMQTYLSKKTKLNTVSGTDLKKSKPYTFNSDITNGVITKKYDFGTEKTVIGMPKITRLDKTSADHKYFTLVPNKSGGFKLTKGMKRKGASPRKQKPGRKALAPVKKPIGLSSPHKCDIASHPIIHGQKEVSSLPVAAVEEEVRDIPLVAMDENDGGYAGCEGHNLGHLEYEITSDDGFTCRADTLDGAWKQVTEKVQDARTASRLKHLSYAGLSGLQLFGLSHPNVMYLIEQLYGASYIRRYKFKYHRHEMIERELELLNPSGCIRTEPFSGRNPWDMFSFLMSRYRNLPEKSLKNVDEEIAQKSSRRATSMDLPMAMRFRKLKEYSRECVGVYRSTIHGRGLFCKRSIDAGEMIIEYAGEVIRTSMTDIREKYYESKGIGCYMFRIDDTDVVDATMKGSAARFINHSCDPNCYSKVITVDNRKHIVIFAMRKIVRGEELTYDYKFPIEEVKIPCTCGSRRCRKYLN